MANRYFSVSEAPAKLGLCKNRPAANSCRRQSPKKRDLAPLLDDTLVIISEFKAASGTSASVLL